MNSSDSLWTRNFTILIFGSAVTMLGHALSSFAISLLVLDYTGSVFLYTVYLTAYFLPQVIVPLFAGTWMDRFSRSKVVWGTDFLSAFIYLGAGLLLRSGYFSYVPFLLGVMLIGAIDSVYLVAYDSLFPNLISEGSYKKGYAISSLLYPLAAMMTPVASWIYTRFGVAPLFFADFFLFFLAACFETRIRAPETYREENAVSERSFFRDMREGFAYMKGEKGLLVITCYFFFSNLLGTGTNSLYLPYFKSVPALGAMAFAYTEAFNVAGSFLGGLIQYRLSIPARQKFAVAMTVYAAICLLDGSFLCLPLLWMIPNCFLSGLLAANSYNIRISTTQSYVPDEMRGRYNGCFQMVCETGTVIGQLSAGALGERFDLRLLCLVFQSALLLLALVILLPNRKAVMEVYNRDV